MIIKYVCNTLQLIQKHILLYRTKNINTLSVRPFRIETTMLTMDENTISFRLKGVSHETFHFSHPLGEALVKKDSPF
jgi:hypothetical protein